MGTAKPCSVLVCEAFGGCLSNYTWELPFLSGTISCHENASSSEGLAMHWALPLVSQGSLQIRPLEVLTGVLSPSWDVCTLRGVEQKAARVIRGLEKVACQGRIKRVEVVQSRGWKTWKHVVMLQKERVCRVKINKCVTPKQVKIRLDMKKRFLIDSH